MKEYEMLTCLICFILGWLVSDTRKMDLVLVLQELVDDNGKDIQEQVCDSPACK